MAEECPKCGKHFKLELENEREGKLSVCLWCLSEALEKLGHQVTIEKRSGPLTKAAAKPESAPKKKK